MILDDIEAQMQKEQLFFWPLCMYSYNDGEGNDWQFPFPNYENGDIFLSWGSVAIKAYAFYKPALALKYVKNVLTQYAKDGLAFQRYGRAKQDGLGDDILSGNSLAVVGLYQAIYGINPLYNRFYLDPHITEDLAGTQIKYNYRNQKLLIDLAINKYAVSNNQFKIISKTDFGFYSQGNELRYFNGNNNTASLKVRTSTKQNLTLDIQMWTSTQMSWMQSFENAHSGNIIYQLNNLKPGADYSISVYDKIIKKLRSNTDGGLLFTCEIDSNRNKIVVETSKP